MAYVHDDERLKARFNRTALLFGEEVLNTFLQSSVAVVGLGGVGSFAAELLARSGIGRIVLVDFDRINISNTNRQIQALTSTIGKQKSEVLRSRLIDINPAAEITAHSEFCDSGNREILLRGSDFIIDAIDSLGPKSGLLEFAFRSGKRIISCMGAANRIDPSKISMADISEVKGCPLARRVRRYLRKKGIEQGIPVIYSSEEPLPLHKITEKVKEFPSLVRGRERETLGSTSYLPAIIASWAVSYVLRDLANDSSEDL
jgi:tRNA A37 threonylcarbamoyladenosine dehydratase